MTQRLFILEVGTHMPLFDVLISVNKRPIFGKLGRIWETVPSKSNYIRSNLCESDTKTVNKPAEL